MRAIRAIRRPLLGLGLLVWGGASVAPGCSQEGSQELDVARAPAEVRAFATKVAQRACEALEDCCEVIGLDMKNAGCERIVPASLRLYYSANVELVDGKVDDCFEELDASLSACEGEWPPPLSACHAALRGTISQGEPCSFDFECKPVSKKTAVCDDGQCDTSASDDRGTSSEDWGESCQAEGDCSGSCAEEQCVPASLPRLCSGEALPVGPTRGSMGDACSPREPCVSDDEECVYNPVEGSYGCQAAGGVDMPCHDDDSCDGPELMCVDELCEEIGGEDAPCYSGGTCKEGLVCADYLGCEYYDDDAEATLCCTPSGAVDQPCSDDGSCDVGLVCTPSFECGFADTTGARQCCREAGIEGQPCSEDGSCADGLGCIASAQCPKASDSETDAECCLPPGDSYDPCNERRGCGAGLGCQPSDFCSSDLVETCCVTVGGAGEPCGSEDSCNEGLTCAPSDACDDSIAPCCQPAGDLHEPCFSDGSCTAGLSCLASEMCYSTAKCCSSTGGPGEPCDADGGCDQGAVCIDESCQLAGGFFQPCLEGETCDEGLACAPDPEGGDTDVCLTAGGSMDVCYADGTCDEGFACAGTGDDCIYGEPCCTDAGGEGQPCLDGEVCSEDLSCVDCDSEPCCKAQGALQQDCFSDRSCDGELSCAASPTCPESFVELAECCLPVGAEGQPCTGAGTCVGTSVECRQLSSSYDGSPYFECRAGGGEGQPCTTAGTCDDGLVCSVGLGGCDADDCCEASGELGQPCNTDDSCDVTTLECLNGRCVPVI